MVRNKRKKKPQKQNTKPHKNTHKTAKQAKNKTTQKHLPPTHLLNEHRLRYPDAAVAREATCLWAHLQDVVVMLIMPRRHRIIHFRNEAVCTQSWRRGKLCVWVPGCSLGDTKACATSNLEIIHLFCAVSALKNTHSCSGLRGIHIHLW